jgi:hypothetical protein
MRCRSRVEVPSLPSTPCKWACCVAPTGGRIRDGNRRLAGNASELDSCVNHAVSRPRVVAIVWKRQLATRRRSDQSWVRCLAQRGAASPFRPNPRLRGRHLGDGFRRHRNGRSGRLRAVSRPLCGTSAKAPARSSLRRHRERSDCARDGRRIRRRLRPARLRGVYVASTDYKRWSLWSPVVAIDGKTQRAREGGNRPNRCGGLRPIAETSAW